jgi:hypothetical protein
VDRLFGGFSVKVSSYSNKLLAASGKRRVDYDGNEKKRPPGDASFFWGCLLGVPKQRLGNGSSFHTMQIILEWVA